MNINGTLQAVLLTWSIFWSNWFCKQLMFSKPTNYLEFNPQPTYENYLFYHRPVLSRSTPKDKVYLVLCYCLVMTLMELPLIYIRSREMVVRPFSVATFQFHKTEIQSFMEPSEEKHKNEKIWLPGWMKPREVLFFGFWCFDNQSKSHLKSQVTHSGCWYLPTTNNSTCKHFNHLDNQLQTRAITPEPKPL